MNSREKRETIHQKLEIMRKCYKERDPENFDLFYNTFFDLTRPPIIIGTDNGAWFHTMDRIRWLILYDWEKWGNLEIDTWNFTVFEAKHCDMVRTRGVLDFGMGRAWDIDLLMIFRKNGKEYDCRLMQFKVPRNEIRPVVILNNSEEEQNKSQKEITDLTALNGDEDTGLMRGLLAEKAAKMLKEQRPYLEIADVRKEWIYVEEDDEGFLFALTGFCVHTEMKALMPFRMVGIGQGYEILDHEFSHPFVSELG